MCIKILRDLAVTLKGHTMPVSVLLSVEFMGVHVKFKMHSWTGRTRSRARHCRTHLHHSHGQPLSPGPAGMSQPVPVTRSWGNITTDASHQVLGEGHNWCQSPGPGGTSQPVPVPRSWGKVTVGAHGSQQSRAALASAVLGALAAGSHSYRQPLPSQAPALCAELQTSIPVHMFAVIFHVHPE